MDPRGLRRAVHDLLTVDRGGRAARVVDWAITALIIVNVCAVVLATVDSLFARHERLFYAVEVVSVAVFTLEYLLRLWACTADPRYAAPVRGRLRFACRPTLVVDLLAVLPFYGGTALFVSDLRVLRAFRLVRLFRLLKLARYADSVRAFGRVLRRKRADLVVSTSGAGLLLLVASSLMYAAEHGAQPEAFSSIPAALWWGVVTLTTVGYGDVYPVTPLGRALGAVIAVLGIGLFALPASILASGFVEDDANERGNCPNCGENLERR